MKRSIGLVAWALLATTPALAAKTAKTATVAIPDVKQWELPNGLHVLFLAEHKSPTVTVNVYYHAGSKDEPADKRGMAHMFEHMMFKGSRHVAPEEHARFVDSVGGNENAFTEDDLTGYYDTVPPSAVDFAIKLEAERMRGLALTQKTIDSERQVVKEELRKSLENNPVTRAFDKILHLAYTVHPYRQFAIGEAKMLDTVTVADCQKFYDLFYQPNNAYLIIVGDADEASVRASVDKYFGPLPRGPEIVRHPVVEPPQTAFREAQLDVPVQLPVLIGAYHTPPAKSDDTYALEVVQQILSGGESSRLYQRLVRKDKTAVFAGGFNFAKEDPGLFLLFAAYLPGSDVTKIKKALDEEMARLTKEPVTAEELTKAKNQLAANAVFEQQRVSGLATQMGSSQILTGDPLRSFKAPARYDAVTAADVQRVAKAYFSRDNLSQVTLVPPAKQASNGGGAQ